MNPDDRSPEKTDAGNGSHVDRVHPGTHAADDGSFDFDRFLFEQELNEVYLLLDFVSGRPDKHFADLDMKIADPSAAGAGKMTASQIIQRVSLLRYPPDKTQRQNAEDAAFLLLVKDALNSLAYPARGMTIAYTTMFMEEDRPTKTDRLQAARLAYPTLSASAAKFRRVKAVFTMVGLVVTLLSAMLLWQVTYGAQLAARFDEAKRNDSVTAAKVHEVLDRMRAANADTPRDLVKVCRLGNTKPEVDDRDSTIQQLCGEYAYRHAQLCVSIADVGKYSRFWLFRLAESLLPMHEPELALRCDPGSTAAGSEVRRGIGRQEDAQSIAGVLTMMSNSLLPILFGLVGTMAAFVRGVQDKVTESVLSPRDSALAFIRLPLGVVAGVCVGLFLSPANVGTQAAGGIGSFTISASGIAFLAGYGSEAFFRALDTLLNRIFSLDAGPSRPAK